MAVLTFGSCGGGGPVFYTVELALVNIGWVENATTQRF
jgi:hypothetical protein